MIPPSWIVGFASLAANLLLFGLWQGAEDELIREIGNCNAGILEDTIKRERLVAQAQLEAERARSRELERLREIDAKSIESARQAALEASARPAEVREVIKEVASANACIDIAMPDRLVDSVFDGARCARPGGRRGGQGPARAGSC